VLRRSLIILAFAFLTCSLFSQHNRNIDSILNLLSKETVDTLRVKHYYKLCWEYLTINPLKAKEYGTRALELATKLDFKRGIAASLNNLGNIYFYSDDYTKAIEYYTKSYRMRIRIDDQKGMSENLNNIGVIYQSKGHYSKALEFFLRALKIDESLKDFSGIAACYNNVGLIMANMKNYPKAIEYYNKSIDVYSTLSNRYGTASAINNKGNLFLAMHLSDSAMNCFMQALEIYSSYGDKNGSAACYNNLAEIYRDQGNYEIEKEFVTKALNLRREIEDKEGIASSILALARIENFEQNYSRALIHVIEALNMARRIGNIATSAEAYNLATDIFANKGDHKTALEYHRRYSALKDSLVTKESIESISDLQVKYETEKQQQAIDILTRDNKIQMLENNKKASEISRQRLAIYVFVIGMIIIASFSFFLLKTLNAKRIASLKLEHAYSEIEEKNRNITDSINYAKRIQTSLLTSENYLRKVLPEHFIIYKPKDIVSGDFYWTYKLNDSRVFVATVDCTGHGVPGAFMSFIASSKLNELVIEKKLISPSAILDKLREEIIKAINPEGSEDESLDGMDITLCLYDLANSKMEFAAANHSVYRVRNNELTIYKGDKMPVGKHIGPVKPFSSQIVDLQKGDMIYTLTDGYSDQTNQVTGKKFKYKALQDMLLNISNETCDRQKRVVDFTFENWKGKSVQVDDVCLIGIRI
jgi:serine phosphatase RsbU (regulator of sigma subunit)